MRQQCVSVEKPYDKSLTKTDNKMMLKELVRPNIWDLKPYSCARSEFKGEARVYLDANENPYGAPFNRYPDPFQTKVKERIAEIKGVRPEQIMLGNGSDEPIDLIYRIFCRPGIDNVVAIAPTYGMYKVCADINDVEYRTVLLDKRTFEFDASTLLAVADANTKVVWLCSPNNPTGNLLSAEQIKKLLDSFGGIVIIDEAYCDFADAPSWLGELDRYQRLIVLQTFSKAWGLAAVRCGMAFASEELIALFNKVKYPYNINYLTQQKVLEALNDVETKERCVRTLLEERAVMAKRLTQIQSVREVFPSDANFLLARFDNADATYKALVDQGIIARNRNSVTLCGNCIRITVGTPTENAEFLDQLSKI